MDTTDYVATLRQKLAASSLPIRSKRLDELFNALLQCPPNQVDQVAALVASVVETLVDPRRRMAMWKKMETFSAAGWQEMAAKRVVKAATRQRPRKLAPKKPVRKPTAPQLEQTELALLGVMSHAVQGAGHYGLELERLVLAGRCSEGAPGWKLLQRIQAALKSAEREQPAAVLPLTHMAGQILSVVEESPERLEEIVKAFRGISPEQIPLVALGHAARREQEQERLNVTILKLQLLVSRADDVAEIAVRLHRRRDLAGTWGKRERKLIKSLEMHLRQGEQLRQQKQAADDDLTGSGSRRTPSATASMRRHHVAYRKASELIARLINTDSARKTPTWWERVARTALRGIEIDSLNAKRLKASRQKELAAEALSAVQRPPTERCMDEEIAAELGRSLGQLEFELSQNPRDRALQSRIDQTRELREHFLSKQKAKARARLQELGESARQRASEGESLADSDWLFDMD